MENQKPLPRVELVDTREQPLATEGTLRGHNHTANPTVALVDVSRTNPARLYRCRDEIGSWYYSTGVLSGVHLHFSGEIDGMSSIAFSIPTG